MKRVALSVDDMNVYLKNLGDPAEKMFQCIRVESYTRSTQMINNLPIYLEHLKTSSEGPNGY